MAVVGVECSTVDFTGVSDIGLFATQDCQYLYNVLLHNKRVAEDERSDGGGYLTYLTYLPTDLLP